MPFGLFRTLALIACVAFFSSNYCATVHADEARVAVNVRKLPSDADLSSSKHPLAPAMKIAYDSFDFLTSEVQDYSCRVSKRERVDGRLRPFEYIDAKVRHEWQQNGRLVHPRSVYLKFVGPDALVGREVLWVEGQNENRMVVRRGGKRFNYITVELSPNSETVLRESNYSPSEMGMLTMVRNLIDVAQSDMQYGECDVKFFRDVKIDNRPCLCIQVTHPTRRDHFKYHVARVFVDNERPIPVRFESYDWPEEVGGKPVLLEEFTFQNIKLNVGFTDAEFRRDFPEYGFRE
jgi:hypothetical protein